MTRAAVSSKNGRCGNDGIGRRNLLVAVVRVKSVDQVLRDHGLTRDNAKLFVALSPLYNRKELGEQLEMSEVSVHRYKRAFRAMTPETRVRVMAALMDELYQELADDEQDAQKE
jgi:hypothetical protein